MMRYPEIISFAYCGNGPEKLVKAELLYRKYGKKLLLQQEVQNALTGVKKVLGVLDSHMVSMNMGEKCSVCAATSKGGCCSAYMGHENNDVLQLLMNLLAGVNVKCVQNDLLECCFLAERGCLLLFKPIFCLNYLCERIQTKSTVEELSVLERRTGGVLRSQVAFEQILITALQN